MKTYDRLFIGGEWVEPSSTTVFDVVSPTTEELVGRVPEAQQTDVDRAVAAAREAFDRGPWPRMTPTERAAVLTTVAEAIRNDMQGMSELISNEMGSPISWGTLAQVLAPTMILDYYAGLGSTFAFDTVKDGLMGPVLVAKEPVGVVAAITPWNVPLFLACAKLAPALLSGSTVVFKPAPETPLDANVLAEIFAAAGLPKGVLSVVRPDARSASTWSTTRTWTRCRSPVRRWPAARSAPPAGPTSSGSAWSWAASRRPSCWTTSISRSTDPAAPAQRHHE